MRKHLSPQLTIKKQRKRFSKNKHAIENNPAGSADNMLLYIIRNLQSVLLPHIKNNDKRILRSTCKTAREHIQPQDFDFCEKSISHFGINDKQTFAPLPDHIPNNFVKELITTQKLGIHLEINEDDPTAKTKLCVGQTNAFVTHLKLYGLPAFLKITSDASCTFNLLLVLDMTFFAEDSNIIQSPINFRILPSLRFLAIEAPKTRFDSLLIHKKMRTVNIFCRYISIEFEKTTRQLNLCILSAPELHISVSENPTAIIHIDLFHINTRVLTTTNHIDARVAIAGNNVSFMSSHVTSRFLHIIERQWDERMHGMYYLTSLPEQTKAAVIFVGNSLSSDDLVIETLATQHLLFVAFVFRAKKTNIAHIARCNQHVQFLHGGLHAWYIEPHNSAKNFVLFQKKQSTFPANQMKLLKLEFVKSFNARFFL